MITPRTLLPLASLLVLQAVLPTRAELTFTGGGMALRLSERAVPLSLRLTADGTEGLDVRKPEPLAEVQSADGVWHAADRARKRGGALELGFGGVDTTLTLAVEPGAEWLAVRVAAVGGTRPRALRFLALNTAFSQQVGERLAVGWDSAHTVCVLPTSPQTAARILGPARVTLEETVAAVNRGEGGVLPRVRLTAAVEEEAGGARFEGASAALIACGTPAFPAAARAAARAAGLPGAADASLYARDAEAARGSALIVRAGLRDADRLVRLCGALGVRQAVLSADAWCAPGGAYAVDTRAFPKGEEDLRAFAGQLRAAGIVPGVQLRPAAGAAADNATLARLAGTVGACGFDLLAFDAPGGPGAVLADRAAAAFQEGVATRLTRPATLLGGPPSARLWQAFGRVSAAPDALPAGGGGPLFRQQVDTAVARLHGLRADRLEAELGPFEIRPPQARDGRPAEGLQLDEWEYLLARALAFDCPVSLRVSPEAFEAQPLAPELLRLFQSYEALRVGRRVSEAQRASMREPGREFTLIRRRDAAPVLAPARPVAIAADRGTRAMVGTFEGGAVATFWRAAGGEARLRLELSPFKARIADSDDRRVVAHKSADERLVLPVGAGRLTLLCPSLDAAALEALVREARPAGP